MQKQTALAQQIVQDYKEKQTQLLQVEDLLTQQLRKLEQTVQQRKQEELAAVRQVQDKSFLLRQISEEEEQQLQVERTKAQMEVNQRKLNRLEAEGKANKVKRKRESLGKMKLLIQAELENMSREGHGCDGWTLGFQRKSVFWDQLNEKLSKVPVEHREVL